MAGKRLYVPSRTYFLPDIRCPPLHRNPVDLQLRLQWASVLHFLESQSSRYHPWPVKLARVGILKDYRHVKIPASFLLTSDSLHLPIQNTSQALRKHNIDLCHLTRRCCRIVHTIPYSLQSELEPETVPQRRQTVRIILLRIFVLPWACSRRIASSQRIFPGRGWGQSIP